jgi:carboxyl-terminal processing protease
MNEQGLIFDKDKFLSTVKKHSYYSDKVDWEKFEEDLNKVKEINLDEINNLLSQIDKHSFAEIHLEEFKAQGEAPLIEMKDFENGIGYLKLPSLYTQVDDVYKRNYEDIIKALDNLASKQKIILDLSENTGGNMYPWIAALAPLYDKKTVGFFEYKYKEEKDGWNIREDGVYCGEKKWFDDINKNNCNFEKIAIVVSDKTASSGEAVAMSFIGQQNVMLFGEKTANFTTGNENYQIGDYTVWLSTCVMQDRNSNSYLSGILPHVTTEKPVQKAVEWLEEN